MKMNKEYKCMYSILFFLDAFRQQYEQLVQEIINKLKFREKSNDQRKACFFREE